MEEKSQNFRTLIVFRHSGLSKHCRVDETLENALSDQDLHSLPLVELFLDAPTASKMHLMKV